MMINALRKHVFDKISVQDLWKLSLFHDTIQNKFPALKLATPTFLTEPKSAS